MIVNTTPEVLPDKLNVWDENLNKEIFFRNKIAYEISIKRKVPYVNHFDLVLRNKNFFNYRDHVHFLSHNEYIILAKTLLDALVRYNIITNNGELATH